MRITTKLIITKIKLSQISLVKKSTIQAKQTVLIKNGSFFTTPLFLLNYITCGGLKQIFYERE